MSEQAFESRKDELHDLVDSVTTHLDVVASWESLCDTYDVLRFTDPVTDAARLEEFKWIIAEMNKFLSRMRSAMMRCETAEAVVEYLKQSMFPTGKVALEKRRALAYQKLRMRWVEMMIEQFSQLAARENQGETKEDEYLGW